MTQRLSGILWAMITPANPGTATLNWVGYHSSHHPVWAVVISTLGAIFSGFLLSLYQVSFWWVIIGVLVAIITVLPTAGTVHWNEKNKKAEDLSAARERVMDEMIPPLLYKAHALSSTPPRERRQLLESTAELVVKDLITAFAKVGGIRAVVYKVNNDGDQMEPLAFAGRSDQPQPFVRGDDRGNYAFESLSTNKNFLFVANIDSAPRTWYGTGKGYATYISAPIKGKDGRGDAYGMLTLDAPEIGDLDSRDGSTVSLFAATLSLFFHEADRRRKNTA